MDKRIALVTILGVVLAGISVRYIAVWCIYSYANCPVTALLHSLFNTVIYPVFLFSIAIFPLVIGLFFVRIKTIKTILLFSAWWLPLSAIVIALTPSTSNSWMPLYFIGKDAITQVMAGIFVIVSLIIITTKHFASKRKS